MQLGTHPFMGRRIEARERFGERPVEYLLRERRRVHAELAGEYVYPAACVDIERYVRAELAVAGALAWPLLAAQALDECLHLAVLPGAKENLVDEEILEFVLGLVH